MSRRPAVFLALVVVAGCSNVKLGHTLDASSASREIARSLGTTTGLPAPAVQCPKGVHVATGQTFDCTTTLEGQPLTVQVTLADNKGRFTFKPAAAILIVARAVTAIRTNVNQQTGGPSTVDCGARKILVLSPGQTFDCAAQAAGVSRTVTVTVSDLAGNVRFQLAPPGTSSSSTTPSITSPSTLPGGSPSTVPGGA